MRQTTREARYQTRTYLSVTDISRLHNPVLRGWLSYYGKFSPVGRSIRFSGTSTRRWLPGAMRKYKRLKGHRTRAAIFVKALRSATATVRTLATGNDRLVRLMGAV